MQANRAMILLVDDNPVQLGTRRVILERAGYAVLTARDGAEGLAILQQQIRKIEMTITDHMMPGMNGVEFVSELRRLDPSMPVMVISGLPDAQDDYDGMDVTVVIKPCPPEHLLAKVLSMYPPPLSRTA